MVSLLHTCLFLSWFRHIAAVVVDDGTHTKDAVNGSVLLVSTMTFCGIVVRTSMLRS